MNIEPGEENMDKKTNKLKFLANIAVCAVLAGGILMVTANASLTPDGLRFTDSAPSVAVAGDKVVLADYRLAAGAGNQVMGEFFVRNSSEQEIKNIDVQCVYLDGADKRLDREQWLLGNRIPAGKTMRYVSKSRRYVHTGSESYKCSITDYEVATASFFVVHRAEGGHGATDQADGHGAAESAQH